MTEELDQFITLWSMIAQVQLSNEPDKVLLRLSATAIFCVQVRNCFLLSVMPTRVASGKSKPVRVGLRTGIPRLRMPMDGIPF
jgi:hypothetical protein